MENKLDFITNMPHEILAQIIAGLPLKEAVRTSILSKSWRNLWIPSEIKLNSDFDQIPKLLNLYGSPELWRLHLRFPENKISSPETNGELTVFTTKVIETELHLEFSSQQKSKNNFELILNSNRSNFTPGNSFSTLRTLHLLAVNHLAGNFVPALFSNTLFLETLRLEKCEGLQNLNLETNFSLQNLIIQDCPQIINISVFSPNLKLFSYRGVLSQILFKSTPNLMNVTLNFRDGFRNNDFDCEEIIILLDSLKEIQLLTISGWLLEWLCSAGVIFDQLEFKFNKLKELRWICSLVDKNKRDSLFCFLNISPFLEKLFINIDRSCKTIVCPVFHHYWHEPHLRSETLCFTNSKLEHLRFVGLGGFMYEDDELLMIDHLLNKGNCVEVEDYCYISRKLIVEGCKNRSKIG